MLNGEHIIMLNGSKIIKMMIAELLIKQDEGSLIQLKILTMFDLHFMVDCLIPTFHITAFFKTFMV